MRSLNRVMLIGHLGADPEVRFTPGGQAVCNFRMATTESWKDKGGQKQERTEWSRIVVWGKLAELCGQHLTKGRQCFVEGKLQTREWEKDGAKQYTTEIVAKDVVFLNGRRGDDGSARGAQDMAAGDDQREAKPGNPSYGEQDDIPF